MQALKENRPAVMWSVLISMTIIMEGYDTILMGNFFAYPSFKEKFGSYYGGTEGWQVNAPWQTGLGMASTVGCIFGGLLNGYLASKYGYRWVMIIALGFINVFIFIVFFATGDVMLLIGEFLCGLSWGVFATLAPAYASEVCPTNLRGYLTTYVNLCWATGQFIASGVLRGCLPIAGATSWKIPLAVQWIWPIPLMVVCWLAPESPWWLVRNDRIEDAQRSITRLSNNKTEHQIHAQVAMMLHTAKTESEVTRGATYADCFKGVNLRRTEIVCVAFCGQILSGSTFSYTPTYFFTTAGMDSADAFDLGLGATAVAFIGVILSWWLITWFGRRAIYVTGMACLTVILMLIGILNVSAGKHALWPSGGLCVLWLFIYSLTVGPIAYSIISETSSTRLRPLSVVLARTTYQIVNVVSQVLEPYMMNPTAWNLLGKTGFVWGSTAFVMVVWSYFRLPEMKGRTYEELDILFTNKVSARNFSKTKVDAYASSSREEFVHADVKE
ncbi:sugar transporter-like protein [Mollisia scopiformis]|uniref:Sugar transporter-like protein n=1 Tax=Mollisia scopiformis TaxID=149040 RepID=A0A132B9X6_MOLSC|nr:sugar transporter-like protein [Mollisia scopiformis]KUJ08799.1 sugar transporter-like protein [Mollisia scopiformis]